MANRLPRSSFRIILESVFNSSSRKAAITAVSLEDAIKGLFESGMSQDEILKHIFDTEAGRARFLDPIANSFGQSIKQNFEQIRHNTRDAVYSDNLPKTALYRWRLVKDNNCEDCISRSLQEPRTMEEWENVGLPQTGATICGRYCGCELEPVVKDDIPTLDKAQIDYLKQWDEEKKSGYKIENVEGVNVYFKRDVSRPRGYEWIARDEQIGTSLESHSNQESGTMKGAIESARKTILRVARWNKMTVEELIERKAKIRTKAGLPPK